MANTDLFNLWYNRFKVLMPRGTDEDFIKYVRRVAPNKAKAIEARLREVKSTAEAEAKRMDDIKKQAQQKLAKQQQQPKTQPPGNVNNIGKVVKGGNENLDILYGKNNATSVNKLKDLYKGSQGIGSKVSKAAGAAVKASPLGSLAKTALGGLGTALLAGEGIYNAAANWNAPGADTKTRFLDTLAPIQAVGGPLVGFRYGGPHGAVAGGVLGLADNLYTQNKAANMRANNVAAATPFDQYLLNNQVDTSILTPEQQARYDAEMRYKALNGGQGTTPNRTPDFTKGVEGSELPADYETPEEFARKNDIDINSLNPNPPIVNLPALPKTANANGTPGDNNILPPRQPVTITGDGSTVEQINNGNGNMNNNNNIFDNDNNDDNFIQNVVNRANNMTVDEARAGLQQNNQGLTGMASNIDEQTVLNQLLNPEGQISPEQMRGYIDEYYNQAKGIANQDPRYGGEYIRPEGYSVDPNTIRVLSEVDRIAKATGGYGSRTQDYFDQQQQRFNAEMANKAGVPYQDYVDGVLQRNKDTLLLETKRVNDQLTAYANQSNDMKTRLEVAKQIMINNQNAKAKLDEIEAQRQANLDVEERKGQWDYAKQGLANQGRLQETALQGVNNYNIEQLKIYNPYNAAKTIGYLNQVVGLNTLGDREAIARAMASLNPEILRQGFGKVPTVDEMMTMMNAVNQAQNGNPSLFQQWLNRYNNVGGMNY